MIIGFGQMKVTNNPVEPQKGTMQRLLVLRLGQVEEVFAEKSYLLKAPCIQTSIAVFNGMSGSPVATWSGPSTQIKPFALLSHAPEPQPFNDRAQSGHSIASLLNARIVTLSDKKQALEFAVSNIAVGKDGTKAQLISSFEFRQTQSGS